MVVERREKRRRHVAMLRVRLLEEQERVIREAAGYAGVSISDWVRERLLRAARRELGRR